MASEEYMQKLVTAAERDPNALKLATYFLSQDEKSSPDVRVELLCTCLGISRDELNHAADVLKEIGLADIRYWN